MMTRPQPRYPRGSSGRSPRPVTELLRSLPFAVLLSVPLCIAACGDDADDGSPTALPSQTPAPSPTPTPSLTDVCFLDCFVDCRRSARAFSLHCALGPFGGFEEALFSCAVEDGEGTPDAAELTNSVECAGVLSDQIGHEVGYASHFLERFDAAGAEERRPLGCEFSVEVEGTGMRCTARQELPTPTPTPRDDPCPIACSAACPEEGSAFSVGCAPIVEPEDFCVGVSHGVISSTGHSESDYQFDCGGLVMGADGTRAYAYSERFEQRIVDGVITTCEVVVEVEGIGTCRNNPAPTPTPIVCDLIVVQVGGQRVCSVPNGRWICPPFVDDDDEFGDEFDAAECPFE